MEPTNSQPTSKNKKMLTIIVLIIIAIIVIILLRSKVIAPVDTDSSNPVLTEESKQLTAEIDSAVTFDNEADLIEIDKEF